MAGNDFAAKDWSIHVNMSQLGMLVVDSWLLYKRSTGFRLTMNQNQFYLNPTIGLVENNYDTARVRSRVKLS